MISGNNHLLFDKNYLKVNEDGTIGFNKSNSYYNDIPDFHIFNKNAYLFKGNIYNFVFVN